MSRATRVTDHMIAAAAEAVAGLAHIDRPGAPLLPQVSDLRTVSATVAVAVALAAARDGVATRALDNPVQQVFDARWTPEYPQLILKD